MEGVDWLIAHAEYICYASALFIAGAGLGYFTGYSDQIRKGRR